MNELLQHFNKVLKYTLTALGGANIHMRLDTTKACKNSSYMCIPISAKTLIGVEEAYFDNEFFHYTTTTQLGTSIEKFPINNIISLEITNPFLIGVKSSIKLDIAENMPVHQEKGTEALIYGEIINFEKSKKFPVVSFMWDYENRSMYNALQQYKKARATNTDHLKVKILLPASNEILAEGWYDKILNDFSNYSLSGHERQFLSQELASVQNKGWTITISLSPPEPMAPGMVNCMRRSGYMFYATDELGFNIFKDTIVVDANELGGRYGIFRSKTCISVKSIKTIECINTENKDHSFAIDFIKYDTDGKQSIVLSKRQIPNNN